MAIEGLLFGRRFLLPEGPFALARTAGVRVVSIFVFWAGARRFRVVLREPIDVSRTSDRVADTKAAAERFATDLEWAIREEPHQWLCFGDVFPPSQTDAPTRV